jgi:hypothetical protein
MRSIRRTMRFLTILTGAVLLAYVTAAQAAVSIIPIGSQPGSGAAYAFVGGSDGNVWLSTNSGGTWHWQDLTPLNVSFGVGATAPGGSPAAYAVATNGDLYVIHQVGSSWSSQNIGTPTGVALRTPVGVISNTSSQPFVFLIGSDGNLWLAHNAGSWSWTNLSRPSGVTLSKAVGAVNIPGSYPQIFIVGSDGNLWVSQWNGSSYPWSNLGHPSGLSITAGLFAWEQGNLPYGFVAANSTEVVWYAHQLSSGGSWEWTYLSLSSDVGFPVGIALNDDVAINVGPGGTLLNRVGVNGGCPPPHVNCPNTTLSSPYTAQAAVGVANTGDGEGSYAFLINTSGHLEVIYGTSGNLGSAEVIDLGTPP